MLLISWLGGAAFAATLAYVAYFYVAVLGDGSGAGGPPATHVLWNSATFGLFALHHSALARERSKRWLSQWLPPGVERTVYVWTSCALLLFCCLTWAPLPGWIYRVSPPWPAAFWAVQGLGVLLTLRGARVIDPLSLAGIRQAAGQTPRDPLRIVGPFRLVRHPIYLGWILMVFGTPAMTTNRLLFAAITSAYLILAIPWEERSLVAAHGDRYRAYQQAVRWRVLPGVW